MGFKRPFGQKPFEITANELFKEGLWIHLLSDDMQDQVQGQAIRGEPLAIANPKSSAPPQKNQPSPQPKPPATPNNRARKAARKAAMRERLESSQPTPPKEDDQSGSA